MRVVIVCIDRYISKDEKTLQKFRAAAKAGLIVLPVVCPVRFPSFPSMHARSAMPYEGKM
jgi:hypothetical protein